jgi:uncharacterized RDD family membrane protein YckC
MSAAAAGFWRRLAAWTLDAALVAIPVLLLLGPRLKGSATRLAAAVDAVAERMAALLLEAVEYGHPATWLARRWLADPLAAQAIDTLQAALNALLLPPVAGFALASLAYHLAFECSRRQATVGQRALGLRVVDASGARLRIGRATLRFGAGALSWITLNLGHAMAALPPRHLALHDRVSGTRVVSRAAPGPLPAWARTWLALQLLFLLLANAWFARAVLHSLQRALEGTA